uniref:Zinc finger protein 611-like n=1 Tax=Diabrotica virgifera virgifera TaxID=50390 RepID=A0A6P7F643_DIAVI
MILVEKQVTEDNPYKCTACNKKTCNLREVYKHVNRYCRYTMKCPFCSKVFRRRQGLDNHVIREHPGKKYVMDNPILKCKLCEYSTVVRKNFHSHLFSHKSKEDRPQYNCNECNFTTYNSSYLKKHRLIKHPVESDTLHTCDKCTYSTYLTSRMTKHLKTHVDNEIFKCDICNGLFGRERSLQRHKVSFCYFEVIFI